MPDYAENEAILSVDVSGSVDGLLKFISSCFAYRVVPERGTGDGP